MSQDPVSSTVTFYTPETFRSAIRDVVMEFAVSPPSSDELNDVMDSVMVTYRKWLHQGHGIAVYKTPDELDSYSLAYRVSSFGPNSLEFKTSKNEDGSFQLPPAVVEVVSVRAPVRHYHLIGVLLTLPADATSSEG